jgi:hypothetical protein
MAELTLARITDIESANAFLNETFLEAYNERFGKPPVKPQKAWRAVPRSLHIGRIISFRYEATVGNDNTVRLGGVTIDIPPGPYRATYAKARVEVRQLLDGSWRVYYKEKKIAEHPSTELREPIRAKARSKRRLRAASPYSWVYAASAQS